MSNRDLARSAVLDIIAVIDEELYNSYCNIQNSELDSMVDIMEETFEKVMSSESQKPLITFGVPVHNEPYGWYIPVNDNVFGYLHDDLKIHFSTRNTDENDNDITSGYFLSKAHAYAAIKEYTDG